MEVTEAKNKIAPAGKRIGILGGTFDPIHEAHLQLGRCARDSFGLDEVWFMPSGFSYYKAEDRFINEKRHREAMVRIALEGEDRMVLSDLELKRLGATYTADTLQELSAAYPENEWYFILGADSLQDLEYWQRPEVITQKAVLLLAVRDNLVRLQDAEAAAARLRERYGADIRTLPFKGMDISSSRLRRRYTEGRLRPEELPRGVYDYIVKHHLYTRPMELSDIALLEQADATEAEFSYYRYLQGILKPERLRHSLSVMMTAVRLADIHRTVPIEKARLAGLLHDCGKASSDALGHGPEGARIAEEILGIDDPEVLSAIRWHTTGHVPMTDLEKIIYISDYIEPFRPVLPGQAEAWKRAYSDLDAAVGGIARATVEHLKHKGGITDPHTAEVAAYYGPAADKGGL